jgi:type I restriction enzyme S subunit
VKIILQTFHIQHQDILIILIFPLYICQSKDFVDRLSNLAKGSSYPAVTNNDVLTSKIPLPLIGEQYKIVTNLESNIKNVTKLKTVFGEQLEYINALPAAILRKAFRGEL